MSLVQRNESEYELKSRRPVKLLVLLEMVRSRSSTSDVIDMKYAVSALKEGVARIVRTFGDRLLAFKFPLRIATKLQSFVDYTVV
jgi:nucleoporin NDC1